jgi:hypothetical protein
MPGPNRAGKNTVAGLQSQGQPYCSSRLRKTAAKFPGRGEMLAKEENRCGGHSVITSLALTPERLCP